MGEDFDSDSEYVFVDYDPSHTDDIFDSYIIQYPKAIINEIKHGVVLKKTIETKFPVIKNIFDEIRQPHKLKKISVVSESVISQTTELEYIINNLRKIVKPEEISCTYNDWD